MRPFGWTKKRTLAAKLLADDRLTDEQIASEVDVHVQTLWLWKRHPDFQARIQSIVAAYAEAIKGRGIAERQNRVDALNDRWDKLKKVIEARAADTTLAEVPGGDTGLIVHQVKGVGHGDGFQLIDLYQVDTGLLSEARAHEKQAAQELGQWVEKVAPTDPTGQKPQAPLGPTVVIYQLPDNGRGDREGA